MKKQPLWFCAFALAAAVLAALSGCTAAPPKSASAAPVTGASAASATENPAPPATPSPTPSPTRDPAGAEKFDYAQKEDAALRAQQYWYADMTTGFGAYRYAVVDSVAASVLDYDTCSYDDALRAMLTYPSEAPTILDRIYDGEGMLVQVHFYVEYESEYNYLGPQYGDGACYVYIFVPVDAARPCETVSGWYSAQLGDLMLRPGQTTTAEGLTVPQSRMLLHQCRALAAAGLREFSSPEDWSEEQTLPLPLSPRAGLRLWRGGMAAENPGRQLRQPAADHRLHHRGRLVQQPALFRGRLARLRRATAADLAGRDGQRRSAGLPGPAHCLAVRLGRRHPGGQDAERKRRRPAGIPLFGI